MSKYEEEKMNEPPKFITGKLGTRSLSRDDSAKALLRAVIRQNNCQSPLT